MSQDNKEVCKIININKDACAFYQEAQGKVKNLTTQEIFKNFEELHQNVITDLQACVRENGGEPEADTTLMGEIQELWGKARAAMTSNVDESLITSLEEAEDRCINSLKEAIANDNISATARIALKKQEEKLQKSHDYMKIMKDNVNAAA